MALKKISTVFLLFIFGFYSETAKSQYCGCSPILCCSKHGYCGITDDHCGSGCKSGPCRKSREPLDRIVTQKFFDGIISQANSSCSGKRFYTRESFLEAANTNLNFTMFVTRLEIATMFAHFTQAAKHFCYIEKANGSSSNCNHNNSQYPCAQGKNYYGRGPIQLSWSYNYGACGRSLGLDLLRQPELVSSNPIVAFRTGLWFWMKSVRPVLNQGFEATIKAINGGNSSAVTEYYTNYCKQLGVEPGLSQWLITAANNIGLNYGLLGDNLPSPSKVINLYKSIGITKIRIFNPNTEVLNALRGHRDIEVTVGVRDQDLAALAASKEAVKGWFATNIEAYVVEVNIAFITVGNEVIPGPIGPQVLPVMQSLTNLVKSKNLSISISTVVDMSIITGFPPSTGRFTSEAKEQLVPVLKLLSQTSTPILVNIYPYFAYTSNPESISLDYATFNIEVVILQDGPSGYSNLFDAIFDTFVWAMEKEGVKDLPMVVSETGWPSAGNGNITTPDIAGTYNRNFVKHIVSRKGTPKRPNIGFDGFLFATFNENQRAPPGAEQNFGLYNPTDMKPIYKVF